MTDEEIEMMAGQWINCVKEREVVQGIKNAYPKADEQDAYAIQIKAASMLRNWNVSILGKKIAFTDPKIREKLSFPDAIYGFLNNENIYQSGAEFSLSKTPKKLEPELAFVLGEDIQKVKGIKNCLSKIEAVIPAFEIIESRMLPSDSCYENIIANNVGFYGAVFGEKHVNFLDIDFSEINMRLYKNGELFDEAKSSKIMGNPLNALIWLFNKALNNGDLLKKGDVILSGSFLPAVSLEAGQQYKAIFDIFGEICLQT